MQQLQTLRQQVIFLTPAQSARPKNYLEGCEKHCYSGPTKQTKKERQGSDVINSAREYKEKIYEKPQSFG